MRKNKPILCLDFDGVIHSYESGWQGVTSIPDPPVPGAIEFINRAMVTFSVVVTSSRLNHQSRFQGAIDAMVSWLHTHGATFRCYEALEVWPITDGGFPTFADDCLVLSAARPPAHVTIDDRALTFDGTWPSLEALAAFKPWNRRSV